MDLEKMGYQIIATTTFKDGVSYDAHCITGERHLIHGPKKVDPEDAINALIVKCLGLNNV